MAIIYTLHFVYFCYASLRLKVANGIYIYIRTSRLAFDVRAWLDSPGICTHHLPSDKSPHTCAIVVVFYFWWICLFNFAHFAVRGSWGRLNYITHVAYCAAINVLSTRSYIVKWYTHLIKSCGYVYSNTKITEIEIMIHPSVRL